MMFGSEDYDAAYRKPYDVERYRALWAFVQGRVHHLRSILDLGCGLGNFLGEWAYDDPPELRVGIDFSRVAIEKAKAAFPDLSFWCVSFEDLLAEAYPIERRYSAVVLCEVLEHLDYDRDLFEFAKSCASDRVVATVPYENRIRGRMHTSTRYSPQIVEKRFGPGIRVVSAPDSKYVVFEWKRPT